MTPELQEFLRLAPIGLLVGAYGTLVGAGGGSVLVPVLLMMLPDKDPSTITGISLAVVFFNAYSGTIAYMRMGRIDYRAGTLFTPIRVAATGRTQAPPLFSTLAAIGREAVLRRLDLAIARLSEAV